VFATRDLRGAGAAVFTAASTLLIAGQFWALYVEPVSPLLHAQVFLAAVLGLGFLLLPHRRGAGGTVPWHDWGLAALSLVPATHAARDFPAFVRRTVLTSELDIAMAVLLVALLFEVCRRSIGLVLPALALAFLAYALSGNVPAIGEAGVPAISVRRLAGTLYVAELGIFSEPIQVAVRWIFIFLLFGAFLILAGGKEFFGALALSLNRRRRGGPAYVAVGSSAMFGMLSGSNVANVMTTGQFTIPLMRRAGFPAVRAAAIESVASTGGALTPPIMAAGALIMAEFTGRPYFDIVAAATIPAALFYLGVVVYVSGLTRRLALVGPGPDDGAAGESAGRLLLRHWPIPLALGWLVFRIADFYPVDRAGLEAIVPLLAGILVQRRAALAPSRLFEALRGFVAPLVHIATACATAGILVGVILLTGAGVELSGALIAVGGESLVLALVLTMVVTIVLGMGVPGIAAYVIASSVIAAPLAALGVAPLAAHMFIFYVSLFAGLTLPVALTAFAAAGIAGTPPFRTAWAAMTMALPAYAIAYAFVLAPELLMQADASTTAYRAAVCAAGVALFACGTAGYLRRRLRPWERLAAAAAGLAFMIPGGWSDGFGAGASAALLVHLFLDPARPAGPAGHLARDAS